MNKQMSNKELLNGMSESFIESWKRMIARKARRAAYRKERVQRRENPEFFRTLFKHMNERIQAEAAVNPRDACMAAMAIAKQNARRAFVQSMKKV